MIRVAVIENESELQRYGYADTVGKLNRIFENIGDEFVFHSYTSANISRLFNRVEDGLMSYDGLFVASNVFNDFDNLSIFRNYSKLICDFISAGKGIYIGYQKKLNIESKYYTPALSNQRENTIKKYLIDFLPEDYMYYMPEALVEVPVTSVGDNGNEKTEKTIATKESRAGEISAADDYDDILLTYPNEISIRQINNRCLDNDFNQHVYKSYLKFCNAASYKVVLRDHATVGEDDFYPLLAYAVPKQNERIVLSTIALDWEDHSELLRNIVEYITKGSPKIAFIKGSAPDKNQEFNFLIESMRNSKLAYHVYNSEDVPPRKFRYHDIYCFSPDVSGESVKQFWNKIKKQARSIKMYHLSKDASSFSDLVMTCYSNNGVVDSIIAKARLWFKQDYERHNNGLWGGFWSTYDVLTMFHCIGEEAKDYLVKTRNAIRPRQNNTNKSYDNVFGCTLGMLTLLLIYYNEDESEQQEIVERILPWIDSTVKGRSLYEKLSYWLTFKEYNLLYSNSSKTCNDIVQNVLSGDKFNQVEMELKDSVVKSNIDMISEIELGRWIRFIQLSGMADENPRLRNDYLDSLFAKRDIEGKWINVSRTGSILSSLLIAFNKEQLEQLRLIEKLEPTLNFLIDSFNEQEGAWAESKQQLGVKFNPSCSATAHAIKAIYLYNSMFPFTSKDFINIVKNEAATSNAVGVINSALDRITKISEEFRTSQQNLNSANAQIKDLTLQLAKETVQANDLTTQLAQEKITFEEKLKEEAGNAKRDRTIDRNRYRKRLNGVVLAMVALAVLVIEQFVIIVRSETISDFWIWLFTLITTVVSFGVSLLLKGIIEKKLFPTDSELFDRDGDLIKKSQKPEPVDENGNPIKKSKKHKRSKHDD